jgi:hypothetical protein
MRHAAGGCDMCRSRVGGSSHTTWLIVYLTGPVCAACGMPLTAAGRALVQLQRVFSVSETARTAS